MKKYFKNNTIFLPKIIFEKTFLFLKNWCYNLKEPMKFSSGSFFIFWEDFL